MGKKSARETVTARFAVLSQSYADPEADENPKSVLVPVSKRTGRVLKRIQFGEDLDDDSHLRADMQMLDDDDEHGIFEDEVEEDFDTDFIQQMITGEGVEEEEIPVIPDDSYPKHTQRGPLEKAFDRMLDDFDEGEVEEDDPRAQGPLAPEDYAPAMEEFIREHAGGSYISDEAPHHRGLLNQLKGMALAQGAFDRTTDGGTFVTTLESDKSKRFNEYFHEDVSALRQLTLEAVRNGRIDTRDVLCVSEGEEERPVPINVPVRNKDRVDCETALSTRSTLYNRPTVIAAATKKIKLNVATRAVRRREAPESARGGGKKPSPAAVQPSSSSVSSSPSHTEDDPLADLPDEALPSLVDLSVRSKNETKEEKQMRRAIVKQLQKERRAQKKASREAYKEAATAYAAGSSRQKNDKAAVSLSVVRRQ